jgi:hypothetical protein
MVMVRSHHRHHTQRAGLSVSIRRNQSATWSAASEWAPSRATAGEPSGANGGPPGLLSVLPTCIGGEEIGSMP